MKTALSPVAETMLLRRQNLQLRATIAQLTLEAGTLQGELHGSLMLIWVLANEKGGELRVPLADIMASSGRVTRVLDRETNEMVFRAIEVDLPTDETPAESPDQPAPILRLG